MYIKLMNTSWNLVNIKTLRCLTWFDFKHFKGHVLHAFAKVIPNFYSCKANVELQVKVSNIVTVVSWNCMLSLWIEKIYAQEVYSESLLVSVLTGFYCQVIILFTCSLKIAANLNQEPKQ